MISNIIDVTISNKEYIAIKQILILLVFTVGIVTNSTSQKIEDVTPSMTREIVLSNSDSTVTFNILVKYNKKNDLKNNVNYYWYIPETIYKNKGGFAGNLLHGKYIVYDGKNRLLTNGSFSEGLKNGIWKTWWDNGELRSSLEWKDGMKDGTAKYYDKNGKLYKTVDYKNGKIDGNVVIITQTKSIIKKYKNGIEVSKKKDKKLSNDKPFRLFHSKTKDEKVDRKNGKEDHTLTDKNKIKKEKHNGESKRKDNHTFIQKIKNIFNKNKKEETIDTSKEKK